MTRLKNKQTILLGSGGHGQVVCDAARLSGLQIDGIISPDEKVGSFKFGIEVVSNHDSLIYSQSLATNVLIGVGLSKGLNYRTEIFEELFKLGIKMPNIIHPSAIIADDSNILQGVQIFAGAIIQPNVTVESGVVVNTKVSIDHGAKIESNCFLGPGVTICGDVTVGAKTLIGAGATILPGTIVPSKTLVKAGTVFHNTSGVPIA